jgi:hypothetical protein
MVLREQFVHQGAVLVREYDIFQQAYGLADLQ